MISKCKYGIFLVLGCYDNSNDNNAIRTQLSNYIIILYKSIHLDDKCIIHLANGELGVESVLSAWDNNNNSVVQQKNINQFHF